MQSIKEKIKLYNLFPKKNFSQNFIYDDTILNKIANAVEDITNYNVIEIGPGPGTLTEKIFAKNPKTFTVIEIDERFNQILHEISDKINILMHDFLTIDLKTIPFENSVVYSNLPYGIASQIMFRLFDVLPEKMVLLFQKEMADRIIAKVGTKDYGKITVMSSLFYDIKKVTDIKPGAFYPVPGVTSTLLRFDKKNNILNIDFQKFNKLLTASFGMRRKQLKNNIKSYIISPDVLFKKVGLNFDVRAEDVSLDQYMAIYTELQGVL